jgi:hypothetical protein
LQLLGKNGEPKSSINITVNLSSVYYNGTMSKTLMTNERGYITLGRLIGVTNLSAQTVPTPDIQAVVGSWRLDSYRNEVQYPSKMCLRQGE